MRKYVLPCLSFASEIMRGRFILGRDSLTLSFLDGIDNIRSDGAEIQLPKVFVSATKN